MKIPFYKNTIDDTHCLQACLKMVLAYYFPKKKYSFSYLDKVSRHRPGKWTWQGSALLHLAQMGFEIINIENLDYDKFARMGERYLRKIWNKQTFMAQKKFSNLAQEQKVAKDLVTSTSIRLINKVASIKDAEKYIGGGYMVLVSINPNVLLRRDGYTSHMVLILDVAASTVVFHDPGLPPMKNRKVDKKLFIQAMTPPAKTDTNLIALKLTR